MLEFTTTFTPADGSAPRPITLRISEVRPTDAGDWSALVEVLGFEDDDSTRIYQVDWTHAIKDAVNSIARRVEYKIATCAVGPRSA